MNKRKAVIKNALFGFGGQFLVMLVGIIVPRMIMYQVSFPLHSDTSTE